MYHEENFLTSSEFDPRLRGLSIPYHANDIYSHSSSRKNDHFLDKNAIFALQTLIVGTC